MDVIARDGTHEGITTMSETIERTDVALVLQNPVAVLTDGAKFDVLYASIKAEATAHQPDTATDKGRKAIAAMAFKITRTKTAIDAAGKQLNEDARARIGVVDAARREIRERLDALADEIRLPLTEWEAAEAARKNRVASAINILRLRAFVSPETTAAEIEDALSCAADFAVSESLFGDEAADIASRREITITSLRTHHARAVREEADRAELDRLRAEAAARAEAEAERERIAEAERHAAAEIERAKQAAAAEAAREEQRRTRAVEEQANAVRRAQHEAEQRATEEIAKAKRDAAEAERRHQAQLARIQQDADDKAATEARRIAAQQADDARRSADREHRGAVMRAAKKALIEHAGLDAEQAKAVVLAITGGHVPAVEMRF
jgi:colicin import membrane protein